MEEINLRELFDYFKSKILIISIILLGIVIIGCTYSLFIKKPMYDSSTKIILVNKDGTTGNIGYTINDVNFNQSLVTTYSSIVKGKSVIKEVIENLDLEYTVKDLTERVSVSPEADTEIIKITVKDEDPYLATDIANEIVEVFRKEITNIFELQNVSQIEVAEVEEEPYNINIIKDLIIYILIGAVISCGSIFVVYYFDTTVKSADEIESKFDLPVFGAVPKVKKN